MKKSIRHIIIALVLGTFGAGATTAQANGGTPQWEIVTQTENSDNARDDLSTKETVEITTRDGALYITVDRPMKVEIYSILGQLITSRKVQAGTIRLTIAQRGVYILKAGSTTRRINL